MTHKSAVGWDLGVKLARLKVSNYSRLQDVELEVRAHLVLVGPNDVGKSSFLRAMDLLLGRSASQLYGQLSVVDFRDLGVPLVFEAELEEFSSSDKALYADAIRVNSTSAATSLVVRLVAKADPDGNLEIFRSAPHDGTRRQLTREQVDGLGWKMVGAVAGARDLREDRRGTIDEIMREVSKDLGTEKAQFDAILAIFADTLNASPVLGDLRDRLATQLSRALPKPIDKSDLSFLPGNKADEDVLSDVRLQVSRAGVLRDLTEQSDGARALFAVALYDLLSAGANVVAIDEPEMHLHPTSQRSLGRLLGSGGNQKVIATHSSDIVAAFDPTCIVAVKPGGVVAQAPLNFLQGHGRAFARWWVRDKLEPLTSSRVIAVEGIADRLILQRVADITGRLLDQHGISVVECGGAGDAGHVARIFGADGFAIGVSFLLDEDVEARTAKALEVAPADFAASHIFQSGPKDLEGEYVAALGADLVWSTLTASKLYLHSGARELHHHRACGRSNRRRRCELLPKDGARQLQGAGRARHRRRA